MWHRGMITKFLTDRKASPETIAAAESRMNEFAREDGMFAAVSLKDALQDEDLERAFIEAWNAGDIPWPEPGSKATVH